MRFLLDECADARIRPFLQEMGHDVRAIAHDYPASLVDPEVLKIAFQTGRILITHDRGFGELIFVKHRPHSGESCFALVQWSRWPQLSPGRTMYFLSMRTSWTSSSS